MTKVNILDLKLGKEYVITIEALYPCFMFICKSTSGTKRVIKIKINLSITQIQRKIIYIEIIVVFLT